MLVKEFRPGDEEKWDSFVSHHADSTFFHRIGWRKVIRDSFGHNAPYLYAEDNSSIVGILPLVEIRSFLFGHSLISNACCVSGGPLASNEDAYSLLTKHAIEMLRNSGAEYLEYRCPARQEAGWTTRNDLYAGFSRCIEADEDDCLKQIPRKQRAVLRKALKGNLTDDFEDSINNLYKLYAVSVRNLGTPVFSKRYFRNLFSTFGEDCRILTVFGENGQALSSVMNFYFKDQVLPFYTGAIPEARRVGASDYQYWITMRDAVNRGYSVFDFGRSKVDTGPYRFKKNWGFEPTPLTHQFYLAPGKETPNVNPTNPKYRFFIEAWKRLPLPIANFIGPLIVKNIG